MRHFTSNQIDSTFLNAFGQPIEINGVTFTGIVDVRPVVVDSGTQGIIEGTETYISINKKDISLVAIDLVVTIDGIDYTIYNIYDDLSGIVEVYIRESLYNNYGGY
ncbi:hypothetical protein [Klebsiella michiganensis]|uniref:hypothetical protein n=1 Tax=Klebsiella michiganensis TaxID=1134687 RepID=UPI0027BB7CEE|nr:hypothetical protein [Klebsiella michiganensis]ELB7344395.1 hypothetical protein [Klebsiella michiganensis]ELC2235286.1 hypothetical protein [Klebsiella michiganensis]ELJ6256800.1 hypothetical protein [Klebsiella michiganensis]MDQ2145300.1 hypothetical protein [Klebsiella michiganensis]MDV6971026.1 hypothetical protein [Klebsiella michiganensis]